MTYEQLIAAGATSLKADEFWCICHPDGPPLQQTASKAFDRPVIIICTVLNADWDDLQEQGFYLDKVNLGAVP
jgi:hypothetical protein